MWIWLLAFRLIARFILFPPVPADILGGKHIRHDWQQNKPTETSPIAPCYPNHERNIDGAPYTASYPTLSGNFFDSILKSLHNCILFQKTCKGTKKK
jgi:hypothetical protein